jgi:serine/threonine protein kinase
MAVLLADFGFSKFGARDDLIQLSRSEPWDAPEWHHRYFMLGDARKTDIYSFGLVCLWMFFPNEILTELGLPSTTVGNAFMGTDPNAVSQIQSKKADDDSILQLALHLLVQKTDLHEEIRSRLRTVFSLALASDPCRRPASMEIFVKTMLGSSEDV